jgi:hypothetical protein
MTNESADDNCVVCGKPIGQAGEHRLIEPAAKRDDGSLVLGFQPLCAEHLAQHDAMEMPALPPDCPRCDRRLTFVDANSPERKRFTSDPPPVPTIFVYQCRDHGPFHGVPGTPLTPGLPKG